MAVELGTNAGFVSVAPSADPSGYDGPIDNTLWAVRDTSPAGSYKVTEMGWWLDNATEAGDYQLGLYSDDATHNPPEGTPNVRLGMSGTLAKGTSGGLWLDDGETLADITLDSATIYWLAVVLTDTATATNIDYAQTGVSSARAVTTLPDPYGNEITSTNRTYSIYALYEAAAGANAGDLMGGMIDGLLLGGLLIQ